MQCLTLAQECREGIICINYALEKTSMYFIFQGTGESDLTELKKWKRSLSNLRDNIKHRRAKKIIKKQHSSYHRDYEQQNMMSKLSSSLFSKQQAAPLDFPWLFREKIQPQSQSTAWGCMPDQVSWPFCPLSQLEITEGSESKEVKG